jgi:hypothetical protein
LILQPAELIAVQWLGLLGAAFLTKGMRAAAQTDQWPGNARPICRPALEFDAASWSHRSGGLDLPARRSRAFSVLIESKRALLSCFDAFSSREPIFHFARKR